MQTNFRGARFILQFQYLRSVRTADGAIFLFFSQFPLLPERMLGYRKFTVAGKTENQNPNCVGGAYIPAEN